MEKFYFTVNNKGEFETFDSNNERINSPVSIKTLEKAYSEGFMAFVKPKIRWIKIRRDDFDGPWETNNKKDWSNYRKYGTNDEVKIKEWLKRYKETKNN